MMNYTWDFSQSETENYFEWIHNENDVDDDDDDYNQLKGSLNKVNSLENWNIRCSRRRGCLSA